MRCARPGWSEKIENVRRFQITWRRVKMRLKRIGMLTTAHLSHNLRLVKEVETLQCSGYEVTVVACRYYPALSKSDEEIIGRATLTVKTISCARVKNPRLSWWSRFRRVGCHIVAILLFLSRGSRSMSMLLQLPGMTWAWRSRSLRPGIENCV